MPLLANINVGASPNDGTGDSIRDSFIIVNENFQLIEAFFPNSEVANLTANISSTGTSSFNLITASNLILSGGSVSANSQAGTVSATTVTANLIGNVTGNVVGSVTGNLVGSSIQAATIGNSGSTLTGTISTAAQPNITEVGTLGSLTVAANVTINGALNTANISGAPGLTLANVYFITQPVANEFGTNVTASNIRLQPNRSLINALQCNANITLTYPLPITAGVEKTILLKNANGSTQYVILPNANNNKASNIIPIAGGAVATMKFISLDTTAANVVVSIVNN